jgi:hypothetical protein
VTAQAAERTRDTENWVYKEFTLTGVKAWKGAMLFLIVAGASAGKVTDTPAVNTVYLGMCWRTVDATAADKLVTVRIDAEKQGLEWFANGDTITAAHIGKLCWPADDNTVQKEPTAAPALGIIRGYDATLGVLVEKFQQKTPPIVGTLPAFAAGNCAIVAVADGAHYDIPTTAANSTISLPDATAYPDGVTAYFTADGTKNGHTLTFRDVATAISAATTASKRVAAIATTMGGLWFVHLTVGP